MANSRDLSFLDQLPPSINTSNEEKQKRQVATKEAEQKLNQVITDLSQDELAAINARLAVKNYLLSINSEKKWVLLDRDSAFSLTYDERFVDFVSRSDDKAQEIKALDAFITQLCEFKSYTELMSKNEIKLLDIGAGDGLVGLKAATLLQSKMNNKDQFNYIGIEANKKVFPGLEKNCTVEKEKGMTCSVIQEDFRKIVNQLSKEPALIALVAHIYTGTKMQEFVPMVLNTLRQDGVCILVHEAAQSDAIVFRAKPEFSNILKPNRDWTSEVEVYFIQANPHAITTTYESTLTFPEFSQENWLDLKKIKQADYQNAYSISEGFSENFKTLKNLIEYVLSDRLEAFNDEDRNKLVDEFQLFLKERNNQIKSICKIQTVLSPNHTPQCENEFLELKKKLERRNSYGGKLFDSTKKLPEAKETELRIELRR